MVEGINRVKKHAKPNPMKGTTGGIVEKEMPMHISNIAIFNPAAKRLIAWDTRLDGRRAKCAYSNPTVRRYAARRKGQNMARLQAHYKEVVGRTLMKQFGYKSAMEVPRIYKITLNMGVGEAVDDKKIMEHAVGDMTKIAGQKPVVTKSKKSIAGFKIRDDYPIGCKVTLRVQAHVRVP